MYGTRNIKEVVRDMITSYRRTYGGKTWNSQRKINK